MLTPTLKYPVHTLDGQQLLPAGTLLDEATLQEVATSGRRRGCYQRHSLLDHGSARHDMQQ